MPTSSRVAPSGRPESDAAAAGQPPGSLRPKSFGWLVRVVRSVLDDKTVAEGADYAEGVEVRHAVERAPGAERHPAGAAVGPRARRFWCSYLNGSACGTAYQGWCRPFVRVLLRQRSCISHTASRYGTTAAIVSVVWLLVMSQV